MAMIDCPDCGHPVSDSAAACPSCARPVAPHTQTIERTDKVFKGSQLIGALLIIGGLIGLIGSDGASVVAGLGLLGGLLLYLFARIGAWWANG